MDSAALPDDDDYYAVLNLPSSCTAEDVRQSYRLLSFFHPDKLSQSLLSSPLPDSSASFPTSLPFLRIQRAFAVLSDPYVRYAYDRYGHEGVRALRKLSISPQLRTERTFRDHLHRSVLAARAKPPPQDERLEGEAEEEDGDGEADDDDTQDLRGRRKPRRRMGARWAELRTESTSTRCVWVLRAFRLFGYGASTVWPDVREKVGLELDQPLSHYDFHYHNYHPALSSWSGAPASLALLPLTAVSSSVQHSTSLRVSPTLQLTAEAALDRRGDRAACTLTTGLQRRWAAYSASLQFREGLGTAARGINAGGTWQLGQGSRVEVEALWDVRRLSAGRGWASALPSSSTLSFHQSLASSTQTTISLGVTPTSLASVEWSVASAVTGVRGVEHELSISADQECTSVEERLTVHIGRRRVLKAFVKLSLSVPHSLMLTPSPANPSPPTASFRQFSPALTIGAHYQPSPSHTVAAWFSVAGRGCSLGLSYRFSSFSLTIPIQLTPEPAIAPAVVALTIVPVALVLGRRLFLAVHRTTVRARLQDELNEAGLRLLEERQALKAWAAQQRQQAKTARNTQRTTRGLVILYARWQWEAENSDPALPSVVDVTHALQILVVNAGVDASLTLHRACDALHSSSSIPSTADEDGALFIRWQQSGKERIREWRAADAVHISAAVDDEPAVLRREAAVDRKARDAYQRLKDSEHAMLDEDDTFW